MEIEMADESAGGPGREPAAAGPLVALVDALPGELGDRAAGTRVVADVEPGCDGDALHFAPLPLDLEEGRLDEIERVVVPEIRLSPRLASTSCVVGEMNGNTATSPRPFCRDYPKP